MHNNFLFVIKIQRNFVLFCNKIEKWKLKKKMYKYLNKKNKKVKIKNIKLLKLSIYFNSICYFYNISVITIA